MASSNDNMTTEKAIEILKEEQKKDLKHLRMNTENYVRSTNAKKSLFQLLHLMGA